MGGIFFSPLVKATVHLSCLQIMIYDNLICPNYSLNGCAADTEAAGPAEGEAVENKIKTDPWKLEPQPIREDQVVNAVNFLSHPKVRSSPIVHRRSFLERKGLTKEEIDEAFRRVPVYTSQLLSVNNP